MAIRNTYDSEKLLKMLLDKKSITFQEIIGKINKPSHEYWSKIAQEFDYAISSKYIYTIFLENRYRFLTKLNSDNNNIFLQNPIDTNLDIQVPISIVLESDFETYEPADSLKVCITLSVEEWKRIYTDNKIYNHSDRYNASKSYDVLTPREWTSKIHSYFFEQTRKSCPIIFKYSNIFPLGDLYLKLIGYCASCNSIFKDFVANYHLPEIRVIINCNYSVSFKNCHTGNKRRIIENKRDKYLNKMVTKIMSIHFIRRYEANIIMNFEENEPSHLLSLNTLRVTKYQTIIKNELHNDPIMTLLLKFIVSYNKIVNDIGYDSFFVYYRELTELNMYRLYEKQNNAPIITLDATGRVALKYRLISNRDILSIFFYQIGIRDYDTNLQFKVAQMLSEEYDNNSISHWLTEWARNIIYFSKIVVTDQSMALIPVVQSFTQYSSLLKYSNILVCLSPIQNKSGVEIPNWMLKNGFNYIMKLLSYWLEIKGSSYRINFFFIRSIGSIISIINFNDIKYLLQCIFIVLLYEEDGFSSENNANICENAKNYLKKRIVSHDIEENISLNDEIMIDLDSLLQKLNDEDSNFYIINYIYDECLRNFQSSINHGNHDNMQYSTIIAKKLLQFCNLIPCCPAVMIYIFTYRSLTETSVSSECLFNDLKNHIFQYKTLQIRVKEFVQIHVKTVLDSIQILEQKENNTDKIESEKRNRLKNLTSLTENNELMIAPKISDENRTSSEDENIVIENWIGQGQSFKKKMNNYLSINRNILPYNDNSKTPVIGILKNGTFPELNSIKINNKYYTITNTCAFDSIAQILCTSYVDSVSYSKFIDLNINKNIFELISHIIKNGINTQTYRKRAIILINISKQLNEFLEGNFYLDCSCTANYIFQQLFTGYVSFKEIRNCLNCNEKGTREGKTIIAVMPEDNLQFFQDVLHDMFFTDNNSKCNNCKISKIKSKYTFGKHVFIELFDSSSKLQAISLKLKDIPKSLLLNKNKFILRGVINFVPPKVLKNNAIGHYVSYCWREYSDTWECYDDLQNDVITIRPSILISHCQYLVYTE